MVQRGVVIVGKFGGYLSSIFGVLDSEENRAKGLSISLHPEYPENGCLKSYGHIMVSEEIFSSYLDRLKKLAEGGIYVYVLLSEDEIKKERINNLSFHTLEEIKQFSLRTD